MSPWARPRSPTIAENVCSACRARMRVRTASQMATLLPSITTGATQDEKVGGTKLFSVCTYPHTKMCEDRYTIKNCYYTPFDVMNNFLAPK